MIDNFNIRDCLWNPSFLFHSSFRDILFNIVDSFHLELSKPTENFPTRYSDNDQDSNSVLNQQNLIPTISTLIRDLPLIMLPSVVATTRHSRTNDLTTSKAL